MSEVITKTNGYHIINGNPVVLGSGQQVSFSSKASVQSFDTEDAMIAAHREQYPEWYAAQADMDLDE
jgi:hypothetical protein